MHKIRQVYKTVRNVTKGAEAIEGSREAKGINIPREQIIITEKIINN
jgi:hypothetical protein